jgi:hypothetical protein
MTMWLPRQAGARHKRLYNCVDANGCGMELLSNASDADKRINSISQDD